MSLENPNSLELKALAEEMAHSAGERLVTRLESPLIAKIKSSTTDLVSDADTDSEMFLLDYIGRTRPNDGVIGEEGASKRSTTGIDWIIDPIDGTSNYLHGYPGWAVSIAVKIGDSVAAAVVHDPVADKTYSAAKHNGAQLNGRAISVSSRSNLSRAIVGTGFSYDPGHRAQQGQTLARVLALVGDIRRGGSAALDLCHVAQGSLDAFYEDDLEIWDWAAAALIVEEAGGVVVPLPSSEGGGVAAGTRGMVSDLISVLR